ncbi:MAG: PKD domain-containing protein [Candidatus Hydrogenedentes bacterium]|nr:PKD domain-containing protein [Candidatus Hydrogenedentota bacterium]
MKTKLDHLFLKPLCAVATFAFLAAASGAADYSTAVTTLPDPVDLNKILIPHGTAAKSVAGAKIAAGPDVNVSVLAGNESEVSIDINPTNPNNLVIAGHSPTFATLNTFFTLDGGATWTRVELGDAEDGRTSTFRFDPSIAFDDTGNVFVAYGATIASGPFTDTALIVARSTDGGQSYTHFATASVAPDDPAGTSLPGSDKWHLATGPDPTDPGQQNVYIALTANLDDPGGLDQRIVLIPSHDNGETFITSLIVNDDSLGALNSTGNLFADPAVGPNGEVYVTWHDVETGEIWSDVSTDGGFTWGTDHLVTTLDAGFDSGGPSFIGFKELIPAQPDRGMHAGPTIDVDRSGGPFNGRVYITYVDLGSVMPDTDVLVRYSNDDGTSWSTPVAVTTDSNSQFLPWLDVDQVTGKVGVVWYDARNDVNNQQVEAFIASSDDGADTFGFETVVSDAPSDQSTNNPNRTTNNFLEYIGAAYHDDVVHPVWADNSTNLADLDYYTDQISTAGPQNQPPLANAGPDSTVDVGDVAVLDGSGSNDPDNGPAALTYAWTQVDGPAVVLQGADTATPSFTANTAGDYTFSLIVNDGQASSAADTVVITAVEPPESETIEDLMALLEGMPLQRGVKQSLMAKLKNALAQWERGNIAGCEKQLEQFIKKAGARAENKLTAEQAAQLIAAAQEIINSL